MTTKAIDSMWFNTAQGHFGFVVGENSVGERCLYAGVVSGLSQKGDEQAVLSWGNRVNISMMEGLIAKVKKESKEASTMGDEKAIKILKGNGITQEEAENFVASIKKGMKEIGEGKIIPFYQIVHEIRLGMERGRDNADK